MDILKSVLLCKLYCFLKNFFCSETTVLVYFFPGREEGGKKGMKFLFQQQQQKQQQQQQQPFSLQCSYVKLQNNGGEVKFESLSFWGS